MNEKAPQLPPDRAHVMTELRNARTMGLHALSAGEIVSTIAREDRAVLEAMDKAGPAIAALVEAIEPRFMAGGRLIYFGAGTSGRLGVLDASEAPPTFQIEPGRILGFIAGGDTALRRSSEGKEDDPDGAAAELEATKLDERDTLIGIAAGGTTPYVLGGLRHGRRLAPHGLRGLIACTPMAKPDGVDHLIVLETGPEVLTGSTRMKAGTATKLALNTISTTLMIRCGRVYENLMVDMKASNAKLRDRAARIIATLTGEPREAAFELLDRAGGVVKTAVVMRQKNVTREAAEQLLERAGGKLHEALRP
jgi:N-acetylmuramic acid 6-phosphate etherase